MTDLPAGRQQFPDVLDAHGEGEWALLRRQIELADEFWLGFIFAASPMQVAVLRRRAENLLRARARTMIVLRPQTPDELRSAVPSALVKPSSAVGCFWLEAVRSDPMGDPSTEPGPWTAAWDYVLLALNERRDALRDNQPGGVVLALPLDMKARVRDAAPDLWSVRSLVLELPGVRANQDLALAPEKTSTSPRGPEPTSSGEKMGFRVSNPALAAQLRRVDRLLAEEMTGDALEVAREAVATARDSPTSSDLGQALAWLSRVEEAHGDTAASADHVREALTFKNALVDEPLKELLDRAGRLATSRGDLPAATAAYEESLALARRLLEAYGETPTALRDLSVSLNKVGDARAQSGDLAAATAAYEESLALRRRLLEAHGETPTALRDLSVSLEKVGNARADSGDVAGAAAARDELRGIAARLMK